MTDKSNTIPHLPLIQISLSRLVPLFAILCLFQRDTERELEQEQCSSLYIPSILTSAFLGGNQLTSEKPLEIHTIKWQKKK